MPTQTQYSVKLYGHNSEDSDRFSRDLAVLLAIDEPGARELLAKVPVIIARTRSREQAEHFQQRIDLIRGLSLVEAEETDQTVADSAEEKPESLDPAIPHDDLEIRRKKDSVLSYVWLGTLVGVSATALIVGGTIFVVQWWRASAANKPKATPVRIESPQTQHTTSAVSVAVKQGLLREKIERLKSKIQDLEFQSKWQGDELKRLYKTRPVPYDEIQHMKVQIATTEESIRRAQREIRQASSALPKQ